MTTETKTLHAPMIHLNGSSQCVLLDGYNAAGHAVGSAIEALAKTYPNGRDYYLMKGNAAQEAMAEHEDRLRKLTEVQNEIRAIADAVYGNKITAEI